MRKFQVILAVSSLREEEKLLYRELEKKHHIVEIAKLPQVVVLIKSNPALVVIRNFSYREATQVAAFCKYAAVPSINDSDTISILTNKAYQILSFRRKGIPMPDSEPAFSVKEIQEFGESFESTYIIKPVTSSWGRGIAKIASPQELKVWAAAQENLDPTGRDFPVVVQRYIEKGNFDIRVLVVGKEPVLAYKRISSGDWRTNVHLGAYIERIEITNPLIVICQQVVSALGDGIYGVDILQDQHTGSYLLCEVNHNPEFAQSAEKLKVNVAELIANFIDNRLELMKTQTIVEGDNSICRK
jgi:[lysine-biosynthesis-protein LysW]---L-2-aminoadipate ligase